MKYLTVVMIPFILVISACVAAVDSEDSDAASASQPVDMTGLKSDCFRPREVTDWQAINRVNLIVYGPGGNKAWVVLIAPPAVYLRSASTVGFESGSAGGRVCGRAGDRLTLGSASGGTFSIVDVRRLDEARLAELTAEDDGGESGDSPQDKAE